jgi:anti-sigma B factor antagonist
VRTAEAPQRLHLDYRLDAGVAVVTVTGEVDVANCELLREGLLRVAPDENDRGLVVNLAGVNFMDSTGLGVLVGVWHRLGARHSSLALAAPSRQIQRILDTTGLARVLAAYDLEADAVQACRQPAGG